MKLDIGSADKAREFVSSINGEKTILLSHTDLDGIAAARIMDRVARPDEIKFIDYEMINKKLSDYIKKEGFKKVIFTDVYIKQEDFIKELESFAEILIIDHHLASDWNSKKTVSIKGEAGYCAGYLCYWIFSEGTDLSKEEWLVACSCISDYCHVKPKVWLTETFKKYGDQLRYEGDYVRKSGKIWDVQSKISLALIYFKGKSLNTAYNEIKSIDNIGLLEKYYKEVNEDVESALKGFDSKKESFDDGYFYILDPKFSISSIISSMISGKYLNKTIVILNPNKEKYRVSIRRQDGKVNCNEFIKELVKGFEDADGGGHLPASGGRFRKEDLPEFRRRLGLDSLAQNKALVL